MKTTTRNINILGPVVLTPALTGQPQAATARSIDHVEAVHVDHGRAKLLIPEGGVVGRAPWAVFDLSVPEKLSLGRHAIPQSPDRPRYASKTKARRALNVYPTAPGACYPTLHPRMTQVCTAVTQSPTSPINPRSPPRNR
jgi:hypothetical protein